MKNNEKKIIGPSSMIKFGNECAKEGMKKILLYGDLGAGKTHFVKGFLKHFDIPEKEILSPTYTYVNTYNLNEILIGHFDMYRIEKAEDFVGKGLLDIIFESYIVLIERPKFEEKYIDNNFVKIEIEKISDNERVIRMI